MKLFGFTRGGVLAIGAVATALLLSAPIGAEKAVPIPAALINANEPGNKAVAVFAGGCFWGTEAVFEAVKGVASVTSGYAGGTAATANYSAVSGEGTGHAEAIRIVYDPTKVSYATLLRVFFSVAHDPTQVNRQGPDVGPSYRSAIFPQNVSQDRAARAYIAQLTKARSYRRAIATRIENARFYPAEAEHQNFMRRNPSHPYILRWDRPKLAAYRAAFPSLAR